MSCWKTCTSVAERIATGWVVHCSVMKSGLEVAARCNARIAAHLISQAIADSIVSGEV